MPPPRQGHATLVSWARGSSEEQFASPLVHVRHEVVADVDRGVHDLAGGEVERDERDRQVHVVLVGNHGDAERVAVPPLVLNPACHQRVEENHQ